MYAVPLGAILEASIKGKIANQTTISVFHYMLNDAAIPDGQAFFTPFNASFNIGTGIVDLYRKCCSDNWSMDDIVYQWIYPTRFRRVRFAPFVGTGSVAQPPLPPNVANVITKKADVASRRGVGTLHVPAVPTNDTDSGLVLAPQKARLQTLADALLVALVTARMTPVLLNRDAPDQSPTITSVEVQSTLRTMRRRTVGLGI